MNMSKISINISNAKSEPYALDNVQSKAPFNNLGNIFESEHFTDNFSFSNNTNNIPMPMLTQEFIKSNENKSFEDIFQHRSNQQHIIKVPNLKKGLTKRTIQDHKKIASRRNSCSDSYENVKQLLQCIFGKWQIGQIREITLDIAAKADLRMDRLAKRYNECLICWFCENWDSIAIHLIDYILTQQREDNNNNTNSKLTEILNIIKNINNICKTNRMEENLSDQYINQILQASSSIDHTNITKINQSTNLPTCDYKNTETINYNNENNEINTVNYPTVSQENLVDQFQTKLTNNFFFKVLNDNSNFSSDFETEFPGLYKEFY